MKRTSAILDYFNEEGEINSYREQWTRCEKIIEEHSQYFQSKKTKDKFLELKLATVIRDQYETGIPTRSTINRKNSNIFGSISSKL